MHETAAASGEGMSTNNDSVFKLTPVFSLAVSNATIRPLMPRSLAQYSRDMIGFVLYFVRHWKYSKGPMDKIRRAYIQVLIHHSNFSFGF